MKAPFKYLALGVAATGMVAALPGAEQLSYAPTAEAAMVQDAAAKKKQKSRKVPAMTLQTHKKIQKAQEAMELKDFVTAKAILDEILLKGKINDYERAVAWQLLASVAFETDDTPGAIKAFEEILKYRESIPVALELSIMFSLSQLHYSEEHYDEAMKYVKAWEKQSEIVSVTQKVYISQLHYVRDEFKDSLKYIYDAIADAELVDTVEVKESWYSIALSGHWELKQYGKVRDVLELLISNWPKPVYWTQLAGIYGELGQEDKSFAITEAAYEQGFLDDKPTQLLNVAAIMLSRDAPIKSAWAIERAYKDGLLEKDTDSLKLLGQSYLRANELEKALPHLKVVAKSENDAAMFTQIANIENNFQRYGAAAESYDKAISILKKAKGNKDNSIFNAAVGKAISLIEMKDFAKATKALDMAEKHAKVKSKKGQVKNWRNYLKLEKAREDILDEAAKLAKAG